jgi:hypothetical protein
VNELLGHDGKTDQARHKRVLRGCAEVLSNLYWWIELLLLILEILQSPNRDFAKTLLPRFWSALIEIEFLC